MVQIYICISWWISLMYMHLYFVSGFKCLLGYLVSFSGKNCSDNPCLVGEFDDWTDLINAVCYLCTSMLLPIFRSYERKIVWLYECIHVSYCFPNRSSVPITKQANKNLILKATAEAEKSVSSAMDTVLKEEKMYSVKGKGSFNVQSTCILWIILFMFYIFFWLLK